MALHCTLRRLAIATVGSAFIALGSSSGAIAQTEASAPAPAAPAVAAPAPAAHAVAAPAPTPAIDEQEPAWAPRHRAYNTWNGSTGGLFVEDPGMAMPGSVRVQLGLSAFSGEDFLYDGDSVEQDEQSFSLSVTALEILELHASLQNRGSVTDLPASVALHTLGDFVFGAKLGYSPTPVVRIGGGLRFVTLNDVGPEDALLDSISVGLRANAAFDLQRMSRPWPMIVRLNLDYFFDNGARIVEDIEDARYDSLPNPRSRKDEVANLIDRFERFGLGINRVDMLTPSFGVEMPLELTTDFYIHPMLEYRFGMPINRGDFDCAYFSAEDDRGTNAPASDDTCLDDAGVDAWPMTLAIGARFVPPWRGVMFALGVDFGLTGTSTFVRELAPTAPFALMFAFGYDYDAKPVEAPPPPPPAPEPPPPPPPVGRLRGTVIDATTNAPIGDVIVAMAAIEHTPLATNVAGRFTTYEVLPSDVQLNLTHPDYNASTCAGTIPAGGGDVEVQCTLVPLPKTGSLIATARDVYGSPVSGVRVVLAGGTAASSYTDADGEARIADLAPGAYQVRFESDGHLLRIGSANIKTRQDSALELSLVSKPATPSVRVSGTDVKASKLKFEKGTTALAAGGSIVLAELADLLLRTPGAGRLEVQADGAEGLALSRALVIKQGLQDLGVPDAQVEAVGEPAKRVTLTLQP